MPLELLRSILEAIESARTFVRERRKDSPLHFRLREASATINGMIKIEQKDEPPFWYNLYEGMIVKYIQLRVDYRKAVEDNKRLRAENKELKERYWDVVERVEKQGSTVERW